MEGGWCGVDPCWNARAAAAAAAAAASSAACAAAAAACAAAGNSQMSVYRQSLATPDLEENTTFRAFLSIAVKNSSFPPPPPLPTSSFAVSSLLFAAFVYIRPRGGIGGLKRCTFACVLVINPRVSFLRRISKLSKTSIVSHRWCVVGGSPQVWLCVWRGWGGGGV